MSKRGTKIEFPDPTPEMQAAGITWRDCYRTPPELLDLVRRVAPIGLDPCTAPDNPTGARVGYTLASPAPDNGAHWSLGGTFEGDVTYVNWPYSDNTTWAERVVDHAAVAVPAARHVIALANASSGTAWFDRITAAADAVCFVAARTAFLSPFPPHQPLEGNQWGTAVWYFGAEADRFADIFGSVGTVMQRYRSINVDKAHRQLIAAVSRLGVDDYAVLTRVAHRIEVGRRRYGEFDLARDKRNWSRELHEELLDMLVYAAARELTIG